MNQKFMLRCLALSILLSLTTHLIAQDVVNNDEKEIQPDDDYVIISPDNSEETDMVKDLFFGEANSPKLVADCRSYPNRYTGMAQVGIPLYSTAQRGVSLDVQLSYSSSGIKLNTLPSWTGYEWKLKAGGIISRVVQGQCDESRAGYFSSLKVLKYVERDITMIRDEKLKWKTIHHRLIGPSDYSPDIFYFSFFGKSGRFFFGQDNQWHVLSESNLFIDFDINDSNNYTEPYFLYNGYTGDAIQEGLPALREKIRPQQQTIKGFTIVDEDGTRYIFGNQKAKKEKTDWSMSFNHQGDCNIDYSIPLRNLHTDTLSKAPTMQADAWYLTEVIDRFGEVLYQFEYERGEFIVDVRPNIHSEVICPVTYRCGQPIPITYKHKIPDYRNIDSLRTYYSELNEPSFGQNKKAHQGPFDFLVKSPVYLKKIIMPASGDSIIFSRSGESDAITSDILYPSLYKYCQSNFLNIFLDKLYGYSKRLGSSFLLLQTQSDSITQFHSVRSREDGFRKASDPLYSMAIRTLKDVSIYRKGFMLKRYEFSYTDHGRKLMKEVRIQDGDKPAGNYLFEYCNPEAIPVDVLCLWKDPWGYYSGKYGSSPDEDNTKCGMLVSVKSPLGAVLDLHYSQNQYRRYRSDDRSGFYESGGLAGGLRVSEIATFKDATRQDTLSHVRYEYSDGELYALPSYKEVHRQKTPDDNDFYIEFFNYNCVLPFQNVHGEHIGYSKVTEWYRNGAHKTFTYSNFSSHTDSVPLLSTGLVDAFGELDYKRGKLKKEELFDECNKLVREVSYIYRTDNTEKNYVLAGTLMLNSIIGTDNRKFPTTYAYYTGSIYKMFYPKYDLVQTRSFTYGQGGTLIDTVSYVKHDYTLAIGKHRVDVRKCEGIRTKRGNAPELLCESYCYESLTDTNFVNQFFLPMTKKEKMYQKKYIVKHVENRPDVDPNVWNRTQHPITDKDGKHMDTYIPDEDWRIPKVTYTEAYAPMGYIGGKQTDFMPMVSRNGIRTMVPSTERTRHLPWEPRRNFDLSNFDPDKTVTTLSDWEDILSQIKVPDVEYYTYHGDGQIETYREKGKPMSRVFFDDEDRIVAKVTSPAELSDLVCNVDATAPEEVITLDGVSVFRLPCTEAVVYRYNEMGLVESTTVGRGMTVHYRYDNIGRLVEERDAKGRVLKRYSYNISYK